MLTVDRELNTCGPCYPYGDDVKRLRRELANSGVEKMFWVGKTSEFRPLWHQLLAEFSIGFGTLFLVCNMGELPTTSVADLQRTSSDIVQRRFSFQLSQQNQSSI